MKGSEHQPDKRKNRPQSLADRAYTHLCKRIVEGQIIYGDSLNIRLISKQLRMSSMPVREALKRLESEGIVIIKPRSICQVKIPTRQSILNAMQMRELLEVYCVETIYHGIDASDLMNLKRVLCNMKKVVKKKYSPMSVRQYATLDREFHTQLCAVAQNDFIDKAYRETSMHLNMRYIYNIGIPPDLSQIYQEHIQLVEALSKKSPRAITLIRSHLMSTRRDVLDGPLFTSLR
jgi:DNA-binding GntR family transcriptional regulator